MNASTSSSPALFERPVPKTPNRNAAEKSSASGLKTLNAHIFPSLHPMGNFYHKKNENQPRPAFQTPKTAFQTPSLATMAEPVKKIKTNENLEKIQPKIEVKLAEDSYNEEETKRRILSEIEEFPVPKLPARLNTKKDRDSIEAKKASIENKLKKLNNLESLVVKDPVINILEVMQNENIEMIQKKIELYKTQLAQEQAKRKVLEYAKWLSMIQDQGHLLLDLEENVTSDEALTGMNESSVSIHMKQNISQVLKACHQSQQRLAEFLKATY